MKDEKEIAPQINLLEIAARRGVSLGVCLSMVFLMIVNSASSPLLALVALFFIIFVIPFLMLLKLRMVYTGTGQILSFTQMWSSGVMIFAFGSLICALVSCIWLQYIDPGFIYNQAREAVAAYEQVPELRNSELVTVLKAAIKDGNLPTAIEFTFNMMWVTIMSGALLSLPLAALARIKVKKR